MISAGRCETGLARKKNQDSIFIFNTTYGCLPNVYIVADGMGGHVAGEVASAAAVECFCRYLHEHRERFKNNGDEILDILVSGTVYANRSLLRLATDNLEYSGMGTTFLCASAFDGKLYISNIGDSRLYIINDEIKQMTQDHSYVMELVRKGTITRKQAETHPYKNMLTKALGLDSDMEVDAFFTEITERDTVLLCSDGLTNMVSESDILGVMQIDADLDSKAQWLVDKANANGGIDNISVILFSL